MIDASMIVTSITTVVVITIAGITAHRQEMEKSSFMKEAPIVQGTTLVVGRLYQIDGMKGKDMAIRANIVADEIEPLSMSSTTREIVRATIRGVQCVITKVRGNLLRMDRSCLTQRGKVVEESPKREYRAKGRRGQIRSQKSMIR